jgi:hypothetical protein
MPGRPMGDLLAEIDRDAPAGPVSIPPRPAAPAPAAPAAVSPASPKSAARRPAAKPARRRAESTGLTESQTPKWQRLERKELRLRADQLDELARLRRALNRQRRGEGERITENTLIRVAVDLLLKQADALQGRTEDELRNSVTS